MTELYNYGSTIYLQKCNNIKIDIFVMLSDTWLQNCQYKIQQFDTIMLALVGKIISLNYMIA